MNREPPALSIVHLLTPAEFGGLESVVITLAPALAAAGHRVAVALVLTSSPAAEHPVQESLTHAGVDVEPLRIATRNYWGERRAVSEVLRRRRATILHTHGHRADIVDAPVARRLGIPTVSTAHGYTRAPGRNRVYEWAQRRALKGFDAVIAVSGQLSAELAASGVCPSRIHTVRNAWSPRAPVLPRSEARRRLGLPQEGRIVGWVGRMTPEKGPDVMVRVAAGVRADIAFSMIGDGPLRPQCEDMARWLGVGGRITWHGAVSDAGSLLGAFDVLAITSWTEGTPMVLLEAMSAGVPIVATAVGGIPDVVSPTEARLGAAGDVQGLADAINELVLHPESARSIATAAERRLRKDFAVEPWAQKHVAIYRSLQEP